MAMRTKHILPRAKDCSADRAGAGACRNRAETRQSRRRSRMHPVSLRFVDSLAAIESSAWDRLVGNRPLLIAGDAGKRRALLEGALALMREARLSSLHILFPEANEASECESAGMLL